MASRTFFSNNPEHILSSLSIFNNKDNSSDIVWKSPKM